MRNFNEPNDFLCESFRQHDEVIKYKENLYKINVDYGVPTSTIYLAPVDTTLPSLKFLFHSGHVVKN